MQWIDFKKQKPSRFSNVLVSQYEVNDDWEEYFIASYNYVENEWVSNLFFHGDEHIRIVRKPRENDKWCEIQTPEGQE